MNTWAKTLQLGDTNQSLQLKCKQASNYSQAVHMGFDHDLT